MAQGTPHANDVVINDDRFVKLDLKLRPGQVMDWSHKGFCSLRLHRISGNRFHLFIGGPETVDEPTIVTPGVGPGASLIHRPGSSIVSPKGAHR